MRTHAQTHTQIHTLAQSNRDLLTKAVDLMHRLSLRYVHIRTHEHIHALRAHTCTYAHTDAYCTRAYTLQHAHSLTFTHIEIYCRKKSMMKFTAYACYNIIIIILTGL